MTTADIALGAMLRQERRRAGWSPARLAAALGLAVSDLARLEEGERRLSASCILRAAKALRRPPGAFLPSAEAVCTAAEVARLCALEGCLAPRLLG